MDVYYRCSVCSRSPSPSASLRSRRTIHTISPADVWHRWSVLVPPESAQPKLSSENDAYGILLPSTRWCYLPTHHRTIAQRLNIVSYIPFDIVGLEPFFPKNGSERVSYQEYRWQDVVALWRGKVSVASSVHFTEVFNSAPIWLWGKR